MSLPKLLLLMGCVLALGLGCLNPNVSGDRARNGVTTHTYMGDPDLERGPGGRLF
jgi:hypothetical protein